MKLPPLLKRLVLSLFSLLLALLAVEGVFRILDLRGYHEPRTRKWGHATLQKHERLPGVRIQFKPNSFFELCYDSNPRDYFDERNCLEYRLNNYGFRGKDWELERTPGRKRVLLIGDSITFGEGVRLEDTFCAQLETLLQKNAGEDVEVLNCGVSSWGTEDEKAFLYELGLQLKPDLVIVVYVLNDPDYPAGLDLWENYRSVYEKLNLRFSNLLSFVYARYARASNGRKFVEEMIQSAVQETFRWDRCLRMLGETKDIAEAEGIRFGAVVFPFMYDLSETHPFKPLHEKVREGCEKHGVLMRDLLPSFLGLSHTDLWVHPSDQHPNEIGHAVAAQALYQFIMTNNLL